MMRYLFILPLLLLLTACGREPKNELPEETATDTITVDTIAVNSDIYIKDRSLYSQEWLADVEANPDEYKPDSIIGEYIFIYKDTVYFDTTLKLKEDYRFTAFTDTQFYQLTVKRINYTTLEYDFSLLENETPVYSRKGKAHLRGAFFLGAESSHDDETGELFFVSEYDDREPSGLTIRIGDADDEGRDNQGRIRADVGGLPSKTDINITLRQSL